MMGTDPEEAERKYRFLRVAFHPDRFRSVHQKKEAEKKSRRFERAYMEFKG
jgi:DnaJ-class molecular chaperone